MTVFRFEEIGTELARPPLAAQRALALAGLNLPVEVWRELDETTRGRLVLAGAAEVVDGKAVTASLGAASLRVQMRHPARDPKPNALPRDLEEVLGPWRPMVAYHWPAMPAFHRFVLASLVHNPRLLWRAMTEIAQRDRWTGSEALPPIHGLLARCEVRISEDSMRYLEDVRFHAGRAAVLARAAGVRAARAIGVLVDSQASVEIGPIELESGPLRRVGLLFQAHVSTADGAFSPTASLLAATTAGVALVDLFREVDEGVSIGGATISDEAWLFGTPDNEATLVG